MAGTSTFTRLPAAAFIAVAMAGGLGVAGPAVAQDSVPAPLPRASAPPPASGFPGRDSSPNAVIVAPLPWERITISLTSSRSTYDVGQPISLRFSVSRDSYVYLFSTDAAGRTRQLFPNIYDTDNFVRARRTYTLPDGNYRLIASDPAGPDRMHLIATTEYYDWMEDRYRPQRSAEAFPITPGGGTGLSDDLRREEQRSLQLGARPLQSRPADMQPNARVEVRPVQRPAWGERFLTLNIRRSSVPAPYYPPSFWDGGTPSRPGPRPPEPPPGQVVQAAEVIIRTTPSGADITINDVFYGRSPLELRLPPGVYDIVAERRGYEPEFETVRVRPGTRQTVRMTLERR